MPHLFPHEPSALVVLSCFPSADATRVMVPPSSMDVTVGESIVLTCQVTHDHSLDIVFTWSFNGHLIDFDKDGDHFERVGGVSINVRPPPETRSVGELSHPDSHSLTKKEISICSLTILSKHLISKSSGNSSYLLHDKCSITYPGTLCGALL